MQHSSIFAKSRFEGGPLVSASHKEALENGVMVAVRAALIPKTRLDQTASWKGGRWEWEGTFAETYFVVQFTCSVYHYGQEIEKNEWSKIFYQRSTESLWAEQGLKILDVSISGHRIRILLDGRGFSAGKRWISPGYSPKPLGGDRRCMSVSARGLHKKEIQMLGDKHELRFPKRLTFDIS